MSSTMLEAFVKKYESRNHKMTIQDIARSATVTRWHSVNCLRYPSIAEHSYLVAMYARDILKRLNPNATIAERLLLLEFCMFHDLPEVLTGDMATPVKRLLESMFEDGESPLDIIEEALCPEYRELKKQISGTYLAAVAKLADVLEAVKFIYVEGKSYIQRQDQNRKIIDVLDKLISLAENNSIQGTENLNTAKILLNEISQNENNDAIFKILTERQTNYLGRVEAAQEKFPEFDWSVAKEVLQDLLYGPTSQIDFIDL